MSIEITYKCDLCGIKIPESSKNQGISLVYKRSSNPVKEWEMKVSFLGVFSEPDPDYKTVNICGDCRRRVIEPSPGNPKGK